MVGARRLLILQGGLRDDGEDVPSMRNGSNRVRLGDIRLIDGNAIASPVLELRADSLQGK